MLSMQREVTSLMGCVDDYLYHDKEYLEQSEAYQNGLDEGKKSGMVEGQKLGQMLGQKLGQKESRLAIAKKMLQAGVSEAFICQMTGVPKKELKNLIQELNS